MFRLFFEGTRFCTLTLVMGMVRRGTNRAVSAMCTWSRQESSWSDTPPRPFRRDQKARVRGSGRGTHPCRKVTYNAWSLSPLHGCRRRTLVVNARRRNSRLFRGPRTPPPLLGDTPQIQEVRIIADSPVSSCVINARTPRPGSPSISHYGSTPGPPAQPTCSLVFPQMRRLLHPMRMIHFSFWRPGHLIVTDLISPGTYFWVKYNVMCLTPY